MKALVFILVPLLNLCCNYIPCSSSSDLDNVKSLSSPSAISGVYKPDEFTRTDFKEYSNSDSTSLTLKENGEITLSNFPESTFGTWEKSHVSTVDGSGTWTSSFNSGTTNINPKITFVQKGIMQPSAFRLFKKSNKYYILIDLGDPDNCTSVRLKQQ